MKKILLFAFVFALNAVPAIAAPASVPDGYPPALTAEGVPTVMQLLQKNLNIKPTLEIRTGYQFNVIVTKDLVFQQPYKAWR